MAQTKENPEFFPPIADVVDKTHAGDEEDIDARPLEEIESLCMQCGEQVRSNNIPISSPIEYSCPSGTNANDAHVHPVLPGSDRNEFPLRTLRPRKQRDSVGGEDQACALFLIFPYQVPLTIAFSHTAEGTIYTVKLLNRGDLDRQLIRSEACSISIPEFQLVLPPSRGQLTTVEGLLRDIVADLSIQQPLRRIQDENSYTKIQEIIDALKEITAHDDDEEEEGKDKPEKKEFSKEDPLTPAITVTLDDPSGNSFLEFVNSMSDPKWNMRTYGRSLEQNQQLGLAPLAETPEEEEADVETEQKLQGSNEEIFEFPGVCSRCGRPLITRMKKVSIPYFKVRAGSISDKLHA